MSRFDILADALADVLSGKPSPQLPDDERRFQARKVATIQQLESLGGGRFDAELGRALEQIGMGVLRGETVSAADQVSLGRLAQSKSLRVARAATNILRAIEFMKPLTNTEKSIVEAAHV